ncbi:MAG: small subunit ribosomal protein [Acidobacteriota bacterium]|jgi:small subunit ribosomal protein S6|nr:small subunit ribosomal protein [Acidobacteriota bacterium]MDT5262635.1 small subunit ribosomal protein [Acidobacteriota bacterium]
MILAEKRVYEVVFIVDPGTQEDEVTRLTENLSGIVTDQGGTVTKNEVMGRRQLAYRIGRHNEGVYVLFEIEGTGREIAELERRMRVNDQVMRYMTVRVDEDRQRAEKFKAKRARKAAKRPFAAAAAGGGSSARSGGGGGGREGNGA